MNERNATAATNHEQQIIRVEDLTVGYADMPVLENISFSVPRGEILSILGPSGCGKSTLIKAITGLIAPQHGRIWVAGEEITASGAAEALSRARRHFGVLFQSGALLQSLTVAENVALPLEEFTDLPRELIDSIVQLKLDLVELGESGHMMPSELSGGMQKRAALARTMALDPQILFCDEPSAGLDPATALEIDGLLLELNDYLEVTLVVVTHELASIENISQHCILLDGQSKGIIASGSPEELKNEEDQRVSAFFQRHITDRPNQRKNE